MSILFINIAVGLFMPIIIFLAIRLGTNRVRTILGEPHKENPLLVMLSTIGVIAGMSFARIFLSDIASSAFEIVFGVICGFLILIFVFCACLCYHKIYLIRKYCPQFQKRHL